MRETVTEEVSKGNREMIDERDATQPGYGTVAKSLHWLIVVLLIAQLAVAWTMPEIHRGTQPETLINLHLSLGLLILAVAIIRLIWRFIYLVPLISDNVPSWQVRAAQALHGLLYLLIFAIPILGWVASSSRGWSVDLFGVVIIPSVLPANPPLGGAIGDYHTLLTWVLLGVVGLHVLVALYHHLVLRDRVLLRMLPGD
jgi:cytochrome b561